VRIVNGYCMVNARSTLEEIGTGLRSLLMGIVPHSSFRFFNLQAKINKIKGSN
jgi:hypothetical protein